MSVGAPLRAPGFVLAPEVLARVRAVAILQGTSEGELVERLVEEGLERAAASALKIGNERTGPGRAHVAPIVEGSDWGVPSFDHVLQAFVAGKLAFPGGVVAAREAWFARWRRPPKLELANVLAALRADIRMWSKREDRYVPAFDKWIAGGRCELPPELLPGHVRQAAPDDRHRAARVADETRKKHDPQAARVGLCWCDPCRANKAREGR